MSSCKECIHYDVCEARIAADENYPEKNYTENNNCSNFKDRTRFVKLPCKIGEYLYRIKTIRGKKFITETQLNQNTFWRIVFGGEYGKTVFLTKEEVEQILKERENNDT